MGIPSLHLLLGRGARVHHHLTVLWLQTFPTQRSWQHSNDVILCLFVQQCCQFHSLCNFTVYKIVKSKVSWDQRSRLDKSRGILLSDELCGISLPGWLSMHHKLDFSVPLSNPQWCERRWRGRWRCYCKWKKKKYTTKKKNCWNKLNCTGWWSMYMRILYSFIPNIYNNPILQRDHIICEDNKFSDHIHPSTLHFAFNHILVTACYSSATAHWQYGVPAVCTRSCSFTGYLWTCHTSKLTELPIKRKSTPQYGLYILFRPLKQLNVSEWGLCMWRRKADPTEGDNPTASQLQLLPAFLRVAEETLG